MTEKSFEVEVVYPYQSAEKNQISLKPKEKIVVLQTDASGWWIGRNTKGQVGIFPSTYTSLGQQSNGDNPLQGLDRENKAILWKVVDQLVLDKKQLIQQMGKMKAENTGLLEKLHHSQSALQELQAKLGEMSMATSPQRSRPTSPESTPIDIEAQLGLLSTQLKTMHAIEIQKLTSQHQEEKTKMRNQHQEELAKIYAQHQEEKAKSQAVHQEEKRREVEVRLGQELVRVQSQWQQRMKSMLPGLLMSLKKLTDAHCELTRQVKWDLGTMQQSLNDVVVQYQTVPPRVSDLYNLYRKEVKDRKSLYNTIQDLRGKVRCYCRLRPILPQEGGKKETAYVAVMEDNVVRVDEPRKPPQFYEFDGCFSPEACQQDVFDEVHTILTSVLDGYNVCIFAYGQTGSGKTYTMEGPTEDPGISYRTVEKLFQQIEERKDAYSYVVLMSTIEVYNDQVYDLLRRTNRDDKIEVRLVNGRCEVPDATTLTVGSVSEVVPALTRAFGSRSTNSTALNERSSRSHSILTFSIQGTNLVTKEKVTGKLNLIDLAGSERISKSKAEGERLYEANNINKSLSNLGRVISALHRKQSHVPFRDSKLTYLLQDSLSGDSRAILIATVSPSLSCVSESLSTLSFASSVRRLELGEAKRHVTPAVAPPHNKSTSPHGSSLTPTQIRHTRKMSDTGRGRRIKRPEEKPAGHEGAPSQVTAPSEACWEVAEQSEWVEWEETGSDSRVPSDSEVVEGSDHEHIDDVQQPNLETH